MCHLFHSIRAKDVSLEKRPMDIGHFVGMQKQQEIFISVCRAALQWQIEMEFLYFYIFNFHKINVIVGGSIMIHTFSRRQMHRISSTCHSDISVKWSMGFNLNMLFETVSQKKQCYGHHNFIRNWWFSVLASCIGNPRPPHGCPLIIADDGG